MNIKHNFIRKIKYLTFKKIPYRLWSYFALKTFRNTWIYDFLYKSYWHSIINSKIDNQKKNQKNYMSINVNPGAGIGHQIANYNAGIWYAKKFNLIHAHTPFPNKKWEKVLGFNFSSICSKKILDKNYKKVKLPSFKEKNLIEISKIKKIIRSYYNQKVIFFLETGQPYKNQYEVGPILQKKFFTSPQRKKDKIIYQKRNFNIAVHVRVGDILIEKKSRMQRYLNIDYFVKAINKSLSIIKTKKKIIIHIFSWHYLKSFSKLNQFQNVQFYYNLNQYKTFLHFVYADLLITSKSSFSYKPGLISKGIKLCPKKFWHEYPKNKKDWILLDY